MFQNVLKHSAIIFVLSIAVILAFLPCLENQFVNWDDTSHLLENHQVRSLTLAGVKSMFTGLVEGTYIPLSVLSYAIEYHFFEYRAFIYHLTNLALHVLVTGLVYWLAVSMQIPPLAALGAALLFGLHPIHVEPVAWVTGRRTFSIAFFICCR